MNDEQSLSNESSIENPPKEISKKRKERSDKIDKSKLSAIYRLSPRHRQFVLSLRRNNWVARDAYLECYKTEKVENADSNASRLMARQDIKDSLIELYDTLTTKEVEDYDRVLTRLAKIAETASRDSDRIRSTEVIAKLQRHLPDESTKIAVFSVTDAEIQDLRKALNAKGKTIPEYVSSTPKQVVESETPDNNSTQKVDNITQPIDTIDDNSIHSS